MAKPTPLGVACMLKHLTFNQAASVSRHWELYCTYLGNKSGVPRKDQLELAVELDWLDPSKVAKIHAECDRMRDEDKPCPDFEKESLWGRRSRGTVWLPLVKIASVLTILVTAGALILTRFDVARIAAPLAILTSIATAILDFFGRDTTVEFRVARFGSTLLGGTAGLAIVFCVYQGYLLSNIVPGKTPELLIDVSFHRLLSGLGVIAACFLGYLTWLQIRRHTMVLHQLRFLKMRTIVARTFVGVSLSDGSSAEGDRPTALASLLDHVADMLDCNPWARRTAWLLRHMRKPEAGAVSIWYLRLNADRTHFHVEDYATCNVPTDANVVFESVKSEHHPIVMNKDRYDKCHNDAVSAAMQENERRKNRWIPSKKTSWREIMKQTPDRHEFVSLTGYVFAKRVPLPSNHADECAVFDRRYSRTINPKFRATPYEKWIDFRSFLAFPISSKDACHGVLIAFRNIRNGFTLNDRDALGTVAHVLGMALNGPKTIVGEASRQTETLVHEDKGSQQPLDSVDSAKPIDE